MNYLLETGFGGVFVFIVFIVIAIASAIGNAAKKAKDKREKIAYWAQRAREREALDAGDPLKDPRSAVKQPSRERNQSRPQVVRPRYDDAELATSEASRSPHPMASWTTTDWCNVMIASEVLGKPVSQRSGQHLPPYMRAPLGGMR